jgi:predicted dehydrogenase
MERVLGVAIVGAGYWGPNLARNFAASADCDLRWVCDLDPVRAGAVAGRNGNTRVTADLADVLNDDAVDVVAIATPPSTHGGIGLAALDAGKHVLVEKPLAASVLEGEKLVTAAERHDLVLMCDHTYCYTPAVHKIRELTHSGELGDIHYVDSVRINLGLVQRDVDVMWDLAPHDISILDFVLPEGVEPVSVAAHGADPIGAGVACIAYLTMPLSNGGIAHVHVNWLSPNKQRATIIGGSRRMLVWNDLDPAQRISMFDKGIELDEAAAGETRRQRLISYRVGDMIAPALPEYEALGAMVSELVGAIREKRPPRTDGRAGLRVLRLLEAASASMAGGGLAVPIPAAG